MKFTPSKSKINTINLVLIVIFFIIYIALFFHPAPFRPETSTSSTFLCSVGDCHLKKVEDEYEMKAVLETQSPKMKMVNEMRPSFVEDLIRGKKVGVVNMDDEDIGEWAEVANLTWVQFERVSGNFKWKDLFPEWVDEEEDNEGPLCPEIPMPDFEMYGSEMDVVLVRLPCIYPENGWARDVLRLQVHLITAKLVVRNGKRGGLEKIKVVFYSACRPMMELFRCDDMVRWEGDWWVYEPDLERLEQKVAMPVGSCQLALPLWEKGVNEVYDLSKITGLVADVGTRNEAYVTVLHSSDAYVCGAITLAQSLLKTGTKRDLVILIDKAISQPKREALMQAGWKIREIERIRNPKAEKNSYNEYNYSKFRLWQLTDYHKVIFIDSDIIVLRSLDILFYFPQMSATGNANVVFNSGIMVIEPSECTFRFFMDNINHFVSYNGGDQGFLNEVYVWWHRLPRRVNFLKNFWSNKTSELNMKNQLFGSDPPKAYTIHYLGFKPWLCYRDYDCNWNKPDQHMFANDVAHKRWWKLHDSMSETLQSFCRLTPERRDQLDRDIQMAEKSGLSDGHWRLNIFDPRREI